MNDEDPTQRIPNTPRQQTAASEAQANARDGRFPLLSLPSEVVLQILDLVRDVRVLRALSGCSRSLKHELHYRCWDYRLKIANFDQIRKTCEVMNFHVKTVQGPMGIPSPIADMTTLIIDWTQDSSSCSLGSEHFGFLNDLERSAIWERDSARALRQLRCLQRDCLLRAFTVLVVEQMPMLDSLSFVPHCDEGREQDRVWSDWIEETIVARRSRETSRKRIRASSDESDTFCNGVSLERKDLPPRISDGLTRLHVVGTNGTSFFKDKHFGFTDMSRFLGISRTYHLGSFDRLQYLTVESDTMGKTLRNILVQCRQTLRQLHLYTTEDTYTASFGEYEDFFEDLLDVRMEKLELLRVDICEYDHDGYPDLEEVETSPFFDFANGLRPLEHFADYEGFCPETIVDFARNHPQLTLVNFVLNYGESHITFQDRDKEFLLFTWYDL